MVDVRSGLWENLRFLVLEVVKQAESTLAILKHPDEERLRKMDSRDNYIDHLKGLIENRSFAFLRAHGDLDRATVNQIRSITVIATNLERIADHAVAIARQTLHLPDPTFFQRYNYRPFFKLIFEALELIPSALDQRDAAGAVRLCAVERELDTLYDQKLGRLLKELRAGGSDVPYLVTALFIFHYLERIGDGLQNIGEAILFAKVGERLKFRQFESLRATLRSAGDGAEPPAVDMTGIWGTRSGSQIGKVREKGKRSTLDADAGAIFKEGEAGKIRAEMEGISRWRELLPGLVPDVLDYKEGERGAALLLQYLEGNTFQEILLGGSDDVAWAALRRVEETMRGVWLQTRRQAPARAAFLRQLERRLPDIFAVHPYFRTPPRQIGKLPLHGFQSLLDRCLPLDDELVAPFSVFGHGDFNLDNVIVSSDDGRVHFVDVHRSEHMDFVQDVSVFLVSCFRTPTFGPGARQRLDAVSRSFYDFAAEFARSEGDETFDARLCAGLARSFATSTRFELERRSADEMMQRACYLMRRLVRHRRRGWASFQLPTSVLRS